MKRNELYIEFKSADYDIQREKCSWNDWDVIKHIIEQHVDSDHTIQQLGGQAGTWSPLDLQVGVIEGQFLTHFIKVGVYTEEIALIGE